ncbi:unnamed protein product [Urochloa humidicola]
MSDSGAGLWRCTAASSTDDMTGMAVAEVEGKKRAGSNLAAEASKLMAEEVGSLEGGKEAAAAGKRKKKWRMSQDQIDYILSMDVSDYVFATPDNMDDMPISDEYKAQYRADRKQAIAVMQENRSNKRKIQEWVKAELEKHGYVEIETTAEMLEKHQEEEYIDGQV